MTDLLGVDPSSAMAGGSLNNPSAGDGTDERLLAQAALDAAEEQLQTLCATHAGAFVSVERRGRATAQSLEDLQQSIQKTLQDKLVSAQQALEEDDRLLAELAEQHRVRRRTLLQHSSLLELLELPSLMDACVRSNLYDEALSIAAFSNTLERRHANAEDGNPEKGSKGNSVVGSVVLQIRQRKVDLRRHLLFKLKQMTTMPQCLEVVTALRRLNAIDLEQDQQVKRKQRASSNDLERFHAAMEFRLQVDFLEARDAWIDSRSVAGISAATDEPLLDAIERYRTRVFEVATQFNAIFRAQQQATNSSLLGLWASRRVHSFLNILAARSSAFEDAAALRDALEASVFFATSMGRLGADFTAQLGPIFEPRMHQLVVSYWIEGMEQLKETLKICREAGIASPLTSSQTTTSDDSENSTPEIENDLGGPQPPPRRLLTLPPLARFVNSILTGLNELRRCLLPSIFSRLRISLDDILKSIEQDLGANERAVLAPGFRGQASQLRDAASRLKSMYSDFVEPYVRGSLEASLGCEAGARRFYTVIREKQQAEKLVQSHDEVSDSDADKETADGGKTGITKDAFEGFGDTAGGEVDRPEQPKNGDFALEEEPGQQL